jgi:hypothetical protein
MEKRISIEQREILIFHGWKSEVNMPNRRIRNFLYDPPFRNRDANAQSSNRELKVVSCMEWK